MQTTDTVLYDATTFGVAPLHPKPSKGYAEISALDGVYLFIGCLGMFGNLFVIIVIVSTASIRKVVTTTFIIHQSLVDALAGLFLIFSTVLVVRNVNYRSLSGEIFCRVWSSRFALWALFMISSLNLIAITMERLLAVWKPIWHKIYFTRTKQVITLAVIWIFGLSMRLLHALADSRITSSGKCHPFGAPGILSDVTGYLMIAFEYLLPVAVFTLSYSKIAWVLMEQRRVGPASTAVKPSRGKLHGGRSIIKIMLMVNFCFLLCWTTNEVYYIHYLTGYRVNFSHPLYHFSIIAVYFNCCCNPFIYIFKYKEFQQSTKKLFMRCFFWKRQENLTTVNSITGSNT